MRYILLFSICLLFNFLKAQTIKDFKSFADTVVVQKGFNYVEKSNKQKILFIGEITDEKNTTYKVFISQLNLSGKGVNDLIFVSKQKEYKYRLNLPSDAPFKISFNELYFKNKGVVKTMKLNNSLNEWFCSPFECFEKI